ncbi:MAG: hypothetical protein LUF85_17175 [Bacteroides sp.]|nr:hypothetical protein [Bacteroides sp.]
MLHRKAYFKYKSEVVSGSKSYERFVRDFCNENIFLVAKSAEQLNEQNRNYNIIQELLSQRQDLVSKYFSSSSFSVEDFRKINKEFNTTHIIPEPIIVQEPKTDIKEKIIVKKNVVGIENPFGCRLKKNSLFY